MTNKRIDFHKGLFFKDDCSTMLDEVDSDMEFVWRALSNTRNGLEFLNDIRDYVPASCKAEFDLAEMSMYRLKKKLDAIPLKEGFHLEDVQWSSHYDTK